MSAGTEGGSMSEARARLLDTATRIFYAEGIHSVGVDRIIAEAKVTRATLYRHFKGKEELILSYLQQADHAIRGQVAAIRAQGLSAPDTVRAVSRAIAEGIQSSGFRGCAFLNAAAEYPEQDHPVHQAVLTHRQWFLETATQLLEDAGCAPADAAGRHFVMLRDGAMAAGCLSDPKPICETFLRGVEGILRTGAASMPGSDVPVTLPG
ncbi:MULTISPECIES: TetR/AcrR family transcriptional regulator [Streptomyces]|uniref:TetR/AcrR family transcriptional regulator n=1 Tax=Streptomyces TaxID=1883 RepID=UPI0029A8425E|nr:TetR/AcrR family transcriptional regulator [Streptomyces sp. WI03-4A]MDX2592102.1 TetR/AcrR family transcriptional regulator [Streptomyces sp. WI03-4A]